MGVLVTSARHASLTLASSRKKWDVNMVVHAALRESRGRADG
jgi:hypothetical protein